MLGTVYGELPNGQVRNIKTGKASEVREIWKTKNPEQFSRIGYFLQSGASRSRKVVKDESAKSNNSQ